MRIEVGAKLKIEQPTADVEAWCRAHLVLDNPDYYKKQNMGFSTYNTPRTICLYERIGQNLLLPFGCLQDIWRMCGRSAEWHAVFGEIRQAKYESGINLYEYQNKAVNEALKRKNGVLVMPCGSGKTQSGLELIARVGGRALWLTHTQDLLNQSKRRAESVFVKHGKFGTITAGKVDIGESITFATVQTMSKLDLSQYRDFFDIVIVDECQHCCGTPTRVTQFYRVISSLCARYKIGLTATPMRADGLEAAMFALLGETIHEVDRDEVKHTTCPIEVVQIKTGWMPDFASIQNGDGTIDYNKVVDNMTHDAARYEVVMGQLCRIHVPCMVLANRVEYLKSMCEEYNACQYGNAVCLSGMGQSKRAKEERKRALSALNSGELDCIFATYQLAKEGLDVPNLRYVVLATPEKDETTVVQSVGRVGRKADSKECGTVIDFVDDWGAYIGWAKKRAGYYKKIGAKTL